MRKKKSERTWQEALMSKVVKVGITCLLFFMVKGVNYLFGPLGVLLLAIIWLIG